MVRRTTRVVFGGETHDTSESTNDFLELMMCNKKKFFYELGFATWK